MRAGIDRDDRVDRQHVARIAAARELEDLAVLALDHDRRTQVLLAAGGAVRQSITTRLAMPVELVERFRHRLAFDQILEADRAFDLGQDRPGVRIPLGDALAALDLVAVVDLQARAVRDAVHGALGAVRIDHRHHHVAAIAIRSPSELRDDVLVLDLDRAVEVRLDERLLGDLRRAADVERAHGELGARLADRLRRDDADRLAHVDRRAAGEIAPVAVAANAVGRSRRSAPSGCASPARRLGDRIDLRLGRAACRA